MRVIIFGGTTEGRILAWKLSEAGCDITVSVATDLGAEELLRGGQAGEISGTESEIKDQGTEESRRGNHAFEILVGRMSCDEMRRAMGGFDICIDATHPYAVEATANIKEACGRAGIEYIRLVREAAMRFSTQIIEVDSAEEAARLLSADYNVLLTTGTKELGAFAEIPRKNLYVRALPSPESIAACLDAGIPTRNIIAMFGPFSQRMNEVILKEYRITHLVTKESGANGGFPEKIYAAHDCGVTVIVIRRPEENGMNMEQVSKFILGRL